MAPWHPVVMHSLAELSAQLRARAGIIGVEGASESGKTTLAGRLGELLSAPHLSTDKFYRQGVIEATYVAGLRLQELEARLRGLSSDAPRVLVEGICLRDTLEALSASAEVFVYCKRLSQAGVWNDSPDLTAGLVNSDSPFVQDRIDRWSHDYHVRVQPHVRADFVYEWQEDAL